MLKMIVLAIVILLFTIPFVYMFVDITIDVFKRTVPYMKGVLTWILDF